MSTRHESIQTAMGLAMRIVDEVEGANGRKRARTADPEQVAMAIGRVARTEWGWDTSGRQSVANAYKYPADYVGWDVVHDGDRLAWAVNRLSTSHSTPLGCSQWQAGWSPDVIRQRVNAALAGVADDSGLVAAAARLHGSCGLPSGVYGIAMDGASKHVRVYSGAHRHCGDAWRLSRWDGTDRYWEHAPTRAEALAERGHKRDRWEAARVADRLAERQRRIADRLARYAPKLAATWADARGAGYCQQGIQAWAEARGLELDAAIPLRALTADTDPRAQRVALLVASRAVAARPRG